MSNRTRPTSFSVTYFARHSALLWCGLMLLQAAAHARPTNQPALVGLASWDAENFPKGHVWVVGGHHSTRRWLSDAAARTFFFPGTRFTIYGMQGRLGEITSGKVEPGEAVGGWLAPGRKTLQGRGWGVALANVSNPMPRTPRQQSLSNATYQEAAASLLRAKGLSLKQARLAQHLRIDLNGDGTEEVLLSAHSRPDIGSMPRVQRGDYSLVALRYLDKASGKARVAPLVVETHLKSIQFSAPLGYKIIGCLDLNEDGRQEIVVEYRYYEGNGIEVYDFDGKSVKRVLGAGWGV